MESVVRREGGEEKEREEGRRTDSGFFFISDG